MELQMVEEASVLSRDVGQAFAGLHVYVCGVRDAARLQCPLVGCQGDAIQPPVVRNLHRYDLLVVVKVVHRRPAIVRRASLAPESINRGPDAIVL